MRNANTSRKRRHRGILGLAGGLCLGAGVADAAPMLSSDPRAASEHLQLTVFASGLDYPNGMIELADGSLLVGTTKPGSTPGYFNDTGTGELIRLTDANRDGQADGNGTVLAAGLPGRISGVAQAGDLIFATTVSPAAGQHARINILRRGATPSDPLTFVDAIDVGYAIANPQHTTYALATRPVPGQPNQHELFFNLGSDRNSSPTPSPVTLTGSGLNTSITADSIVAVTLTDTGSAVTASAPTLIATGLRNAAGMAFDPATGDLYFQDNGIDGIAGNPAEALSADELNRIAAVDLGQTVPDFGYADDYIDYRTGQRVVTGTDVSATQPIAAFTAITSQTAEPTPENEGASQIAFLPNNFPPGLAGGVLVGFHGQIASAGTANEENPLVYVDPDTGEFFHLISPDDPGVGHLDGLLATEDTVFIADLGASGSLFNGSSQGTGVIYRLTVIPEPLTGLVVAGMLCFTSHHRPRRALAGS